MGFPFALPPPLFVRHLPNSRMVPSSSTVQRWFCRVLQSHICTGLPSAVPAAVSSRHFETIPEVIDEVTPYSPVSTAVICAEVSGLV